MPSCQHAPERHAPRVGWALVGLVTAERRRAGGHDDSNAEQRAVYQVIVDAPGKAGTPVGGTRVGRTSIAFFGWQVTLKPSPLNWNLQLKQRKGTTGISDELVNARTCGRPY